MQTAVASPPLMTVSMLPDWLLQGSCDIHGHKWVKFYVGVSWNVLAIPRWAEELKRVHMVKSDDSAEEWRGCARCERMQGYSGAKGRAYNADAWVTLNNETVRQKMATHLRTWRDCDNCQLHRTSPVPMWYVVPCTPHFKEKPPL